MIWEATIAALQGCPDDGHRRVPLLDSQGKHEPWEDDEQEEGDCLLDDEMWIE